MNRWCQINFYVQLAIIILAVLSFPFTQFVGALLLLMPFGAWQVISSIIFGVQFQKVERRNRGMFKTYWSILAILGIMQFLSFLNILNFYRQVVLMMVTASALGIFYFIISIRMTRNRAIQKTSFLPNILDQF